MIMRDLTRSVSPKGQVTIPLAVRRRLGLKPKDRVEFSMVGDSVKIAPARSRVDLSYQAIPALARSLTDKELTDLAWEDHVEHVAQEGVDIR